MKYSYNFMRGWNCAHYGVNITGNFFDDDARRGYYSYLAASLSEQVPFAQNEVDSLKPARVSYSSLITHFKKKFNTRNARQSDHRTAWYEEAIALMEKATRMERLLIDLESVFLDYAKLHSEKGTADGRRKAAKNAAYARKIREVNNG